MKLPLFLLALPYVVTISSDVVDCWITNPDSHYFCSRIYVNEDGDSYATRRITITKNGEVLPPFSVGFSTSNTKDFNDRLEAYNDMAYALNEAHRKRNKQDYEFDENDNWLLIKPKDSRVFLGHTQ